MTAILLDTCAALWLANGSPLADGALEALEASDRIVVSPISAWELGQLTSRRRLSLSMDTILWWEALLEAGVELAAMDAAILIASSTLPGAQIRDPVDRILVATARRQGFRIMTRDRPILTYAASGHVQAIAC
jgi:PIN domain nuclease of toxin-antitoxin system